MYLYGSHVAFLGASGRSTIIQRWDNTLGQYADAGSDSLFAAVQNIRARAISADGKYYAQ